VTASGGLALTNPTVQRLRRLLGRRSARSDEGRFVVEGPVLVAEALAAGLRLERLFLGPDGERPAGIDPKVPVHLLAPGVADKVGTTVAPQPVFGVFDLPVAHFDDVIDGDFIVICAGLSDPGNLGTIARSAEAAGATALITTPGTVEAWNPKCVCSACPSSPTCPSPTWRACGPPSSPRRRTSAIRTTASISPVRSPSSSEARPRVCRPGSSRTAG
jgi:TrmH family RNA methyltransferase